MAGADSAPRFFASLGDGGIRCGLCPRRCTIADGVFGACGARGNKGGKALIPFYGFVSALSVDPIEKKPLYHFDPGSRILSVGFTGCNLHCPFCQNWRISQSTDVPGRIMRPAEIVSAALHAESAAIAYTYSEPLVHAEFLLDCMALARRHGLSNVLITNGCACTEAAREILALVDAANIDLKCFSAQNYSKLLGGDLQTVLEFIRLAYTMDVHVEITTLVVPDLNNSAEELERCADFIAQLSPEIPWHLSAYHPDYRWNAPATDPAFLMNAAENARKKLRSVYTGNIAMEENNTGCAHCKAALVKRRGYHVDASGLAVPAAGERFFLCARCGAKTGIVRTGGAIR
jgi:pyruvate formate lyase activating enzyme